MSFELEELRKAQVGDIFRSRKNKVFKSVFDGKPVVVKVYPEGAAKAALKEHSILGQCQERGVSAPIPLGLRGNVILMTYSEGPTLAEFLDSAWIDEARAATACREDTSSSASSIGEWLARFHGAFDYQVCRGDANIRNFIIGTEGIVGLDFEESGDCEVIDDLGQICSSVLSMHPLFSKEKAEFCRAMAEAYFSVTGRADAAELSQATARALEHYAQFRTDGELLVRKADQIRRTGIWSCEE